MSTLVLLSADDCHLCEHGKKVLTELAGEGVLSWREVPADSEEGRTLELTAPPMRPVLYANGHVVGYGRLSAKRLRRQIARAEL
jgi:hypothetical protein